MRLLATHILVKPDSADQTTPGGIFIPSVVKQKVNRGKVLATGPGVEGKKMVTKEGDYIQYRSGAGTPWEYEGQDCLIMRMEEIQFVI